MTTRTLARGALSHLAARTASVGLGLLVLVAVARQGPQVQGAFSLLVATEALFAALLSGIGLAGARQVSHHREDASRWLGAALLLAFLCGAAGGVAFWAAGAGWFAGDASYAFLPLLAVAAPWLVLIPTVSGLCLGLGWMTPINLLTLGPPVLTLAGLGCARAAGIAWDAMTVMSIWLAARAAVGVAGAGWAWWHFGARAPVWSAWRPLAGFCTVVGLTNLVSWLNYRADLFIVERYTGLASAGVYSVAVSVAELLWFLSSSVTAAAYGRLGASQREEAIALAVRLMHLNLVVLLAAAPVLALLAAWALPAWLGADYRQAVPLLLVLLPGVWAYACASTLSAYYTNGLGRPQWAAGVAGFSLAVNVATCLWLVPRLGALGAALATSLSYLLAIAWGLWRFQAQTGWPWRRLLWPDWARLGQDLWRSGTGLSGPAAR
ncbi:MAG TPA: polysaccharide biosynthesis C-terminal domain-containing protein [Burkholderiaceae bacterium]|nr:polysaccharide biosynthesis C-terminal domain-containing protein [Burkholderiaceae bacterium]